MNQKERMLAGLPYKAWMDGLSRERLENKKKIFAFNHLEPDRMEEQEKLLKVILGKTGEHVRPDRPAPDIERRTYEICVCQWHYHALRGNGSRTSGGAGSWER